jgi:hypothetical protein
VNVRALTNPAFLVALGVMSVSAIGMQAALDHYKLYLQKKPILPEPIGGKDRVLRALPAKTEHWQQLGSDLIEAPENLETLGTENYLTRRYIEKSPRAGKPAREVTLHVAYYTGMIDTVPHVPERCLVGAGLSLVGGPWVRPLALRSDDWMAVPEADNPFHPTSLYTTRLSNEYSTAGGGRRVNLPVGISPEHMPALRITEYTSTGGARLFAGYFFIANGGIAASAEDVRALAFDLKNDYAFYLKVQIGPVPAESPDELAEVAGSLLSDLFGEIMTCVPDWARVQRGEWPADNPKAQTRQARRP